MASDHEAASELGYDPCWIDGGVLASARLAEQLAHCRGPEGDPNVEHYRAAALADYLARNATLSDGQVAALLQVARAELARELQGHVFHALVKHRGLTSRQLGRVKDAWDDPAFRRVALREELLRSLRSRPVPASALDRAQAEGDSVVHAALLTLRLREQRLAWLARHGASRSVRAQAKARLKVP